MRVFATEVYLVSLVKFRFITNFLSVSVMKMFIAFALLIATVAALPMETAERSTKQLVAEPEGTAADALSAISGTVSAITTTDLDALATKVGGIETDVPAAVSALVSALAAAA